MAWTQAAVQQMAQGVAGYQDVQRLATDVEEVVRELRSLAPKVDSLVKNDGTDVTLMVLDGTIPMYHNQKKYNCPVKFWMGLDYPSSPPICYVSPTRDMGIKPRHVHVDNAGFIYHLYLTQWNVRSSLKELCSTLTTVFSKDPPVYAKPQGGQGASHPPSQQQQSSSQPQQQVQPSSQPQPAEIRPVPQPERPPPAAAGKSHQLVQQPPSQASSRPPPNPSSAAAGVAGAVTQAAAGSWAGGVAGGWATGPSSAAGGNVEEESKDSLISFVMSKINAKYESFRRNNDGEFDEYQSQQTNLEVTQQSLSKAHQALSKEKTYLLNLLDDMDKAEAVISAYLTHVEQREKPRSPEDAQVESLVHASDVLAQQLMECVSHDRALEDVLYELDCALGDGKIETAEYLRLVHKLSRQQFMEKELAFKILAKRRSLNVY